ncbi:Methyltransferase type 11 [Crinalium epipsammum PCC 9333]|uniref:Methyltransferase type 11 n=1 Tax=Crinalium epipsammum PCC 9333 TaxID=1173022 RepID=K9W697_9CYAN|nr:class I SAM-dependent methyltransferase [Crinalium epipsammum]AFZ14985.1 Methyltransferase type 11 [Crinalium epipsammum PCC 9333]
MNLLQEDNTIKQYYEDIAFNYDRSRFANSYGQYIDSQERLILSDWLPSYDHSILDLACGTGRFLDFATTGLDASKNMITVAQKKYPNKQLIEASATSIPLPNESYDAVFTLHLFMHLTPETINTIIDECVGAARRRHRILRPGGMLIFDIPSAFRRKLLRYKPENWHGATSFFIQDIKNLSNSQKWQLADLKGIAFCPVHRLPSSMRPLFIPIDNFLCRSFCRVFSSYYMVKLIKQ